jgi:hypothetical protein
MALHGFKNGDERRRMFVIQFMGIAIGFMIMILIGRYEEDIRVE